MRTVFAALTTLVLLAACEPKAGDFKTLEWQAGQGALRVTKTFEASRHGRVLLALDASSLCGSSGVRVRVEADGQPVFEETVAQFPYNNEWKVDSGADMKVTTTIVDVDSNIQCVQLGDVRVTVKY